MMRKSHPRDKRSSQGCLRARHEAPPMEEFDPRHRGERNI
jgi:hypothetical protein